MSKDMTYQRALAIAAIWAAPAFGIWVTGESAISWTWILSYWATIYD